MKAWQVEVAQLVMGELERRFECDVLVEDEADAQGEHVVHVMFHSEEMAEGLVNELTRHVCEESVVRFELRKHLPRALSLPLPPTVTQTIITPLADAYDVAIDSASGSGTEGTVVGAAQDVECVDMALARFCRVSFLLVRQHGYMSAWHLCFLT